MEFENIIMKPIVNNYLQTNKKIFFFVLFKQIGIVLKPNFYRSMYEYSSY